MRHEAALAKPGEDGVPRRDHLEASAAKGNAHAIAALAGPEFPEALGYLYDWLQQLVGRSGADLNGTAPLAYGTIAAWAALTDQWPTPYEVEALLTLDAVVRHPEPPKGG